MAIVFNKQDNTFTLHTKNTTYQMKVDQYGVLLHLYYGSRTAGNMDYLLTYTDRGFSGNPHDVGQDRTYSLDVLVISLVPIPHVSIFAPWSFKL